MIPLIPILAVAGIIGGTVTLGWYASLSNDQKYKANKRANEIAMGRFKKELRSLTEQQYTSVMNTVKKEMKV